MADVQTEAGYFKIANRLAEAIIEAGFSKQQLQVLLTLMRLTFGWQRRSVRLTELALARQARLASPGARRASGAFRDGLSEVVREGVVFRDEAGKRGLMVWAINKDFERWGRFAVAEARLKSAWGERPESSALDDAAVGEELAQTPATRTEGDWPGKSPHGGPISGHTVARQQATSEDLDDSSHNDLPDPKDRERQGKTNNNSSSTTTAAVDGKSGSRSDQTRAYAIGLTTALNLGIKLRWGEQRNPVVYASGLETAEALTTAGVELEFARQAIRDWCARTKKAAPPVSVGYLRNAVLEAHRFAEQRELDAGDAGNTRSGGGLTSTGAMIARVDPDAKARAAEAERDGARYDVARRAAVSAWRDEHAIEAQEIGRAVIAALGTANTAWMDRARDSEFLKLAAKRIAFPEFEAWRATQHAPPVARVASADINVDDTFDVDDGWQPDESQLLSLEDDR